MRIVALTNLRSQYEKNLGRGGFNFRDADNPFGLAKMYLIMDRFLRVGEISRIFLLDSCFISRLMNSSFVLILKVFTMMLIKN